MSEGASERSNSPKVGDDRAVGVHTLDLRDERTFVNLESVQGAWHQPYAMANDVKALIRDLKDRSGLSLDKLAKRAGFAGASSIQRYFDEERDRLDYGVAGRFAKALVGLGAPAITEEEVYALSGLPAPGAKPFQMEGASLERMRRDVPVYGTALGAPEDFDGEGIEQTTLNTGDTIAYFERPTILNGRAEIYGLFVQGSSMYPRFGEGEVAFVDGKRPPMVGDDVIVYLCGEHGEIDEELASAVLLKRLIRRTGQHVELEQFNPAKVFKVPSNRVRKIHRVVPWSELLS